MSVIRNVIYKILTLQEKFLRKRLEKTLGAKNFSKRKKHFSKGCTLDLSSLADEEKNKFEAELTNILKTYDYDTKQILGYIKNSGTDVIYIKDAGKILNTIRENEGFIYPATGLKAVYLSFLTNKKFALRTKEMFIVSEGELNKYYFIYHVYNWFAFKNNIYGIDAQSQELLKKYLFTNADTKELQLNDIYKLKDAIKQDKAAIEFVVKLCRNYEGAKQALNKLQNNGSAKL